MRRQYLQWLSKGGLIVLSTGVLLALYALELQKTPTGYTGIVHLSNVTIEQAGNGYAAVKIPGFYNSNPIGMAGLPEAMFRLAIGRQKMVPTIKVTELEVEHKVLTAKIHPMQEDFPINIPVSQRVLFKFWEERAVGHRF